MLGKKDIQDILEYLAENNTEPYLSEAQFQFELAWVIKEKFNNAKILLEYTACTMKSNKVDENGKSKGKTKRFESDIIVLFDNEYQVIELKYKTARSTINNVQLVTHGGQPGTKYDYLWDIHRIELLKEKPEKDAQGNFYTYLLNKKCSGGYAIFLTNDSSYYGGQEQPGDSAYQFRLENSREIDTSKVLVWEGEEKNWMSSRPSFSFIEKRQFGEWKTFYEYTDKSTKNKKSKHFKYLITEIK